ncbi:MAG: STAS domain-containing protein [Actinomycetota bacterium]|nr:STAS domain-containing protein [Actinomycetota bacterium]
MTAKPPAAAPVRLVTTPRGQEAIVEGRLDVHTVADVRLALHALIADGRGDLYLHLGSAEIGDATGIGVLVEAHRRARRSGRRLVLGEVTPRTERLLRAARLHRVIHRGDAVQPTVAPLTA